ncbi:MAG TPA: MarR family transcriptional regulator [Actinomycetota bacterium]|nr:MarR family transcriptional regulator [Actinomycetota bacterium]
MAAGRLDDARSVFVDGMGTASATSGVLSQLQGRIFALLYLRDRPVSLDEIAEELQQSKSNISMNIRGLVDWHLVRRVPVPSSRKDHYEAVADLWRVTQEIMERRFRWNIRQVIAACDETRRAAASGRAGSREAQRERAFIESRLEALRSFAAAVDAGIEAFSRGEPMAPPPLQAIPIERRRQR